MHYRLARCIQGTPHAHQTSRRHPPSTHQPGRLTDLPTSAHSELVPEEGQGLVCHSMSCHKWTLSPGWVSCLQCGHTPGSGFSTNHGFSYSNLPGAITHSPGVRRRS